MKPNLDDVTQVVFRHFGKNEDGVPKVSKWDKAAVPRGKAWGRVNDHVKGNGKPGPVPGPDQPPTELSIKLAKGKTAYVISFDLEETHTVFGPGSAPITLLPADLSAQHLSNVGLVFPGAAGGCDFLAAKDIGPEFDKLPAGAALLFTCDRDELEKVWNCAFAEHGHQVPLAVPIFLNLYDTVSKLPVWVSAAHMHSHDEGSADKKFETHGGIHPTHKSPETHGGIHPADKSPLTHGGIHPTDKDQPGHIVTHGGIHPTSNVQMLY